MKTYIPILKVTKRHCKKLRSNCRAKVMSLLMRSKSKIDNGYRCLNTLMKRNYFETSTHLINEHFALEPKRLASKVLKHNSNRGRELDTQCS